MNDRRGDDRGQFRVVQFLGRGSWQSARKRARGEKTGEKEDLRMVPRRLWIDRTTGGWNEQEECASWCCRLCLCWSHAAPRRRRRRKRWQYHELISRCNPFTGLDDCCRAHFGTASRAIAPRAVMSSSRARPSRASGAASTPRSSPLCAASRRTLPGAGYAGVSLVMTLGSLPDSGRPKS